MSDSSAEKRILLRYCELDPEMPQHSKMNPIWLSQTRAQWAWFRACLEEFQREQSEIANHLFEQAFKGKS